MNRTEHRIVAEFQEDSKVYTLSSPHFQGLNLQTETPEEMKAEIEELAPILLEMNHGIKCETFRVESQVLNGHGTRPCAVFNIAYTSRV